MRFVPDVDGVLIVLALFFIAENYSVQNIEKLGPV